MIENEDFKLVDLVEPLRCDSCGKELPRGTAFCPNCGYEIKKQQKQNRNKIPKNTVSIELPNDGLVKPINKWVSFLLCLFFGLFGVHKFYEGNVKMGIIYIFTCGLFGIGWIIDVFVILFKPNPYYVSTI